MASVAVRIETEGLRGATDGVEVGEAVVGDGEEAGEEGVEAGEVEGAAGKGLRTGEAGEGLAGGAGAFRHRRGGMDRAGFTVGVAVRREAEGEGVDGGEGLNGFKGVLYAMRSVISFLLMLLLWGQHPVTRGGGKERRRRTRCGNCFFLSSKGLSTICFLKAPPRFHCVGGEWGVRKMDLGAGERRREERTRWEAIVGSGARASHGHRRGGHQTPRIDGPDGGGAGGGDDTDALRDGMSMLHGMMLGSTGKERGDRLGRKTTKRTDRLGG